MFTWQRGRYKSHRNLKDWTPGREAWRKYISRFKAFSFCPPIEKVPSRELTYPTLGKGKSSSKCHFWGIWYVSSLEGIYARQIGPFTQETGQTWKYYWHRHCDYFLIFYGSLQSSLLLGDLNSYIIKKHPKHQIHFINQLQTSVLDCLGNWIWITPTSSWKKHNSGWWPHELATYFPASVMSMLQYMRDSLPRKEIAAKIHIPCFWFFLLFFFFLFIATSPCYPLVPYFPPKRRLSFRLAFPLLPNGLRVRQRHCQRQRRRRRLWGTAAA